MSEPNDGAIVEQVVRAMAGFGEVLRDVTDEHLELATPCTEWDVTALISHVVLGDAAVPALFDGRPLDSLLAVDRSLLGHSPMATWRGTALAAVQTFRRPGAMAQLVDHPVGPRAGSVVAGFRLVDVLGHTWDLATAVGQPLELPEDLATAALNFLFPMVDELQASEVFAAAIEPPENASAGVRFLALIGRSG